MQKEVRQSVQREERLLCRGGALSLKADRANDLAKLRAGPGVRVKHFGSEGREAGLEAADRLCFPGVRETQFAFGSTRAGGPRSQARTSKGASYPPA
jgi:hypothetical protein